jgi:tetratricopeptide (TPR) repeat protein
MAATHPPALAKETWTSVRSKNFTLVGNANERDIRAVANRLEQFRAVFGALFPDVPLNSTVPTVVIVFKNDSAFKPYKVRPGEAGYFQPGEDKNYIALTSERASESQPFRTMFHEYVHLLVNNSMGVTVPLWFNEGLAEYYSTFDIDDRRVLLGNPIDSHILYLRSNQLLPLRTLLAVDYKSPYYNEANHMNIFYAESWMFMHYLLQSDGQRHRLQLTKFIDLLRAGASVDQAFPQTFQTSVESVEKDFKRYILATNFAADGITLKQKLDDKFELQTKPVTEADRYAYLGELLAHTNRLAAADAQLQEALTLDPESLLAHYALGMMYVRQGRTDEARPHLAKAINGDPENFLLHYYYAYALSELNMKEHRIIASYSEEVAATMRQELNKVIALKPDYAESYWLLGFVNLVRNEQIDETIEALKHAPAGTSTNHRLLFMLAQLYIRKENFFEARELLTPIVQDSSDADLQDQAAALAKAITQAEEQRAQIKQKMKEEAPVGTLERTDSPATMSTAPTEEDTNAALSRALRTPRTGEERVEGLLTAIDCSAKGLTFQVRTADRLLKFHSDNFERIIISTFTAGVGRDISCGSRKPANLAVLTYTPAAGFRSDGEVKAIEFVPATFALKQ